MWINFLFMALVSSGSAFSAAVFRRKYENSLPIAIMSMVLILFLFGVVGMLKAGSVFYFIVCMLLTFWNCGKLASGWDEFSHWLDTVKAAVTIDDFSTNEAAQSMFQSYPPGMMLFQYALQKLVQWLEPGTKFSEWRVYFSYQVFCVSLMLPFLKGVTFRQPVRILLYVGIILLSPLLFFRDIYRAVYIDPFVGILFGTGMAMIVLCEIKDGWYDFHICLLGAMLTLAKDVGFGLAVIMAISYGADRLLEQDCVAHEKKYPIACSPLLVALITKLLWSLEINLSGARKSFDGHIDWLVLVKVLLGRDGSYRVAVVENFRDALYSKTISFDNLNIQINYIGLLTLVLVVIYLLYLLIKQHFPEKKRNLTVVMWLLAGTLVFYIAGLCVIYMFKFSEYEAVNLASMDRYMNIVFVSSWIFIMLVLAQWACQWSCRIESPILLLLMLVLMVPTKLFGDFIRGDYIKESNRIRQSYSSLENAINETCDGDDRIYIISQETSGFDYWVLRYSARPNSVNGNFTWSIGESFYDGDIWTREITLEQWKAKLLADYDYVAIYKLNDYFIEHFGSLFTDPDTIEINALYCVNRETGLLDRCEYE